MPGGSKFPYTWETGPAPLRVVLDSGLALAASAGAEIGILSQQLLDLRAGKDTQFTQAQIAGFVSAHDLSTRYGIDDVTAAETYELQGDDSLTPVT